MKLCVKQAVRRRKAAEEGEGKKMQSAVQSRAAVRRSCRTVSYTVEGGIVKRKRERVRKCILEKPLKTRKKDFVFIPM